MLAVSALQVFKISQNQANRLQIRLGNRTFNYAQPKSKTEANQMLYCLAAWQAPPFPSGNANLIRLSLILIKGKTTHKFSFTKACYCQ